MKTHIAKIRFVSNPLPEALRPGTLRQPIGSFAREYPGALPIEALEDPASGTGQPDSTRPGLAIAQEEVTLTVVRPAQGTDLALATPREQKEAQGCNL